MMGSDTLALAQNLKYFTTDLLRRNMGLQNGLSVAYHGAFTIVNFANPVQDIRTVGALIKDQLATFGCTCRLSEPNGISAVNQKGHHTAANYWQGDVLTGIESRQASGDVSVCVVGFFQGDHSTSWA